MATRELKSIKFPDLGDIYEVKVTEQVLNTSLQALSNEVDTKIDNAKTELNDNIAEANLTKADAIVKSASGEVASFSDGGNGLLVKSLIANITPKQSGSGDPSPSNVRPISGYESVNVTRVGKNLLPKMTAGTYSANGGTIVVDNDGVAHLSGTTTASGNVAIIPLEEPFILTQEMVDNGAYLHLNNSVINGNLQPTFESNPPIAIVFSLSFGVANRIYQTISNEVGKRIDRIRFYVANGVALSGTFAPSLEFTNEATAYEPYQGTSYPISLGQTVYGGTLDVVSGKLTITQKGVDMGSVNWGYNGTPSSGVYQYVYNFTDKASGRLNFITESFTVTNTSSAVGTCVGRDNNGVISFNSAESTAEAFKTSVNGQKIVYELATPTEITLTPTQVKTLLGNNNIFADSGSVEVEYRADTTLAYNELLSLIASLS